MSTTSSGKAPTSANSSTSARKILNDSPVRQYRIVRNKSTPTIGLLAGLAVTLSAVAVYACFTIVQLRGLRQLQTETIDHNRKDSLLLLRIQNDLNAIGGTIRDMLDGSEPYPLTAYQSQFTRIR